MRRSQTPRTPGKHQNAAPIFGAAFCRMGAAVIGFCGQNDLSAGMAACWLISA